MPGSEYGTQAPSNQLTGPNGTQPQSGQNTHALANALLAAAAYSGGPGAAQEQAAMGAPQGLNPGRSEMIGIASHAAPMLAGAVMGIGNMTNGAIAGLQQQGLVSQMTGVQPTGMQQLGNALAGATGITGLSGIGHGLGGYGDIGIGGYTGMQNMADPGVDGPARAMAADAVAGYANGLSGGGNGGGMASGGGFGGPANGGSEAASGQEGGQASFAKGGEIEAKDLSGPKPNKADDGKVPAKAGEFIVNKAMVEKYLPILQAINAGTYPIPEGNAAEKPDSGQAANPASRAAQMLAAIRQGGISTLMQQGQKPPMAALSAEPQAAA